MKHLFMSELSIFILYKYAYSLYNIYIYKYYNDDDKLQLMVE